MFPENFPDVGGWDFEKVWKERPKFCRACLEWTNATGFFLTFQKFCVLKNKESKNASTTCLKNP